MSEHQRGGPQGPPWSRELLADLHAGAVDAQTAAELRALQDPGAEEVLEALEATRAELATLPELTMPEDVGARIEAALGREVRTPSADRSGEADEVRPSRTAIPARVAAATTAALAALALLATGGGRDDQLAPPVSAAPLSPEQLSTALRTRDYGPLTDPQRLAGCLRAHGAGEPVGASPVTLDGHPAELLVLPGPAGDRFRLLAVGPECGPQSPATLVDTASGG